MGHTNNKESIKRDINCKNIAFFDIIVVRRGEVYALALKDTNEIQGLVGIRNDKDSHAAYMHWACTAPHNNIHDTGYQKYSGVGGHLFAIVADKPIEWGYEGAMHGFAADQKLLDHYMSMFQAEYLGMLHQYQFFIDEEQARLLLEVYHYNAPSCSFSVAGGTYNKQKRNQLCG